MATVLQGRSARASAQRAERGSSSPGAPVRRTAWRFGGALLVLVALLCGGVGSAGAATVSCSGGGSITIDSNNVVTGHSGGCNGAVEIPATVTAINGVALMNVMQLTSVTFASPSSLTTIGNSAFRGTRLTSITVPSSVTAIGERAFSNIPGLASVVFEGNAPSVGPDAFSDVAPGATAYRLLDSTGFTVSGDPPRWNGLPVAGYVPCGGGGRVNVDLGTATVNGASACTGSVAIPSSVTAIGADAFKNAATVTGVTFAAGSGLTSIGTSAFQGATGLIGFTVPAGVTSIGASAFRGATALTSVAFATGSSPLAIGASAFRGATSLTGVAIPSRVTAIGDNAFDGATDVTSVTFASGSGLTTIGVRALAGLPNLSSIVIPSGVTYIGDSAFSGATSLASVVFEGNAPTTVGAGAFTGVPAGATAYRSATATGFSPVPWNGLQVAVYLSRPPAPVATAGELSATVAAQAAATGPAASSLVVTASPGGASCVVSGASGSCTVTGLTAGTAYTFTTVARSASPTSESEASPASAAVTPTGPAAPVTPPATATTAALRTAAPTVVANGVAVEFTASGPGTASASGTVAGAKRGVRAGTVVCSATLRVKKAGKVRLVCTLNAAGRKLRTKGALKVVLTTRFVPTQGATAVATRTVTIPRKR